MTFFGRIRNTVFLARPTVDGPTPYSSVSDPYSLNPDPDPAKNLNPDPGKFFSPTKKFA